MGILRRCGAHVELVVERHEHLDAVHVVPLDPPGRDADVDDVREAVLVVVLLRRLRGEKRARRPHTVCVWGRRRREGEGRPARREAGERAKWRGGRRRWGLPAGRACTSATSSDPAPARYLFTPSNVVQTFSCPGTVVCGPGREAREG